MALAGFSGCEVGNKYPRDIALLKHKLSIRGLQICNAWLSTYFADGRRQQTIEQFIEHRDFLYELGAKVIGCSEQTGSIQSLHKPLFGLDKPIFNDKQWRLLAEGYNLLADIAAEKGMQVCLHHHMGTGVQTRDEIDRYLDEVNNNVYLLFDTGHAYYAEGSQQSMLEILQKHLARTIHVHLKDVRDNVVDEVKKQQLSFREGVVKGTFTVPGDGNIDFKPVFSMLNHAQYQGWMVVEAEQDPNQANPFDYALKGRQYIRNLTGL